MTRFQRMTLLFTFSSSLALIASCDTRRMSASEEPGEKKGGTTKSVDAVKKGESADLPTGGGSSAKPRTAPSGETRSESAAGEADVQFDVRGKPMQGGVIFVKTEPGAKVTYQKRSLRVTDDGTFILAFGPNHPPKAYVEIALRDGRKRKFDLEVEQREYITEEIDDLPDEEVDLSGEMRKELAASKREIEEARMRDTAEPYFQSGFEWPTKGPITGIYGSRRVLNGKKASRHWGVDIGARKGAAIHSPADGVAVYVSEEADPLAGKLLVIDHGFGLSSSFLHLSKIDVKKGDLVKKGQRVAHVGSTGRATGAHLDWRMNYFDTRVDPESVVERRSDPAKLAAREAKQQEAKQRKEERATKQATGKQDGRAQEEGDKAASAKKKRGR